MRPALLACLVAACLDSPGVDELGEAGAALGIDAPTGARADISDGHQGQLYVSWNSGPRPTRFEVQATTNGVTFSDAGVVTTAFARHGGLTPGVRYGYRVRGCSGATCGDWADAGSNVPVTTACGFPDFDALPQVTSVAVDSGVIDPKIEWYAQYPQYYGRAGAPRRGRLFVSLPGSQAHAGADGYRELAQRVGYDLLAINYVNDEGQIDACGTNLDCYANISQAKLDVTGPCARQNVDPAQCGTFSLTNTHDGIERRIVEFLRWLEANDGPDAPAYWGRYLDSAGLPDWSRIAFAGHSQGGDMATFAGYRHGVSRVLNFAAPPLAVELDDGGLAAASWFSGPRETRLDRFYGFVSVNDVRYRDRQFQTVWQAMGFDPEERLDDGGTGGLDCSAAGSHNLSTHEAESPASGHHDVLFEWNEDVWFFMLTH